MLTVSLRPFVVNEPRVGNWKVKKVTDKWIAFRTGR